MFSLLRVLQDSVAAVSSERHFHWMTWLLGFVIVALIGIFAWRFSQRNKPSSSSGSGSV